MSNQKVKVRRHSAREEALLIQAVQQLSQICQLLDDADIEHESILHLFAQAYASVGIKYDFDPDEMVSVLSTNGMAMGLLMSKPDMTATELERAVERCLAEDDDDEEEPVVDRSSPDPDMPMFLVPGLGEA